MKGYTKNKTHSRRHKGRTHKRKQTHRRKRKISGGSLLTNAFGAAKTALLPLIMYKAQKSVQHRRHKKTRTKRKSKRSRK